MKALIISLFCFLFVSGVALSQPLAASYSNMKVNAPWNLDPGTDGSPGPSSATGCVNGFSTYVFKLSGFADQVGYCTYNPGLTGNYSLKLYDRQVSFEDFGFGCQPYNSDQITQFISVTVVNDLSFSWTAVNICSGVTTNLKSYANYPDASYSIVSNTAGVSNGAISNPTAWSPVQGGSYTIRVSRNFDNGNTNIDKVINVYPPVILSQPTNNSACPSGGAVSFSVSPSGGNGPFTYQWYESINGGSTYNTISSVGIYSGTTTSTLTITGAPAGYSGYFYRVAVTNSCNNYTSTPATLTFFPQVGITSSPVDKSTCIGSSTIFSTSGIPRNGSLFFQWQEFNGSWSNLADGSYSYATIIGSNSATLNLSNIQYSSNNRQYRCYLYDACGAINAITTSSALLTVYPVVNISIQPTNTTICDPGNASFSVLATAGNGGLNYQWQTFISGTGWVNLTNTAPYSNVTSSTLNLSSVTVSYSGIQYRCIVVDACGGASQASSSATLIVNTSVTISGNPSGSVLCVGSNVTFTGSATGTGLSYKWQQDPNTGTFTDLSNGGNISGANTNSLTISSVLASQDNYKYRLVGVGSCGNVNSSSATLTVNSPVTIIAQSTDKSSCAAGSVTYTILASGTITSYQWRVNTGSGFSNITNGGNYSGASTSSLTVSGLSGTFNGYQYNCILTGPCGNATTNTYNLTVNVAPLITADPTNQAVCSGSSASFISTASGTNLSYQWTLGGVNIASATSTAYTIGSVNNGNAGNYRVTVSNACGSVQSAIATLTVNPLTFVATQPTNQQVCPAGIVTLTVVAGGTASYTYYWEKNTGAGFFSVGINSPSYTITGAGNSDAATYQVKITGSCGPQVVSNSVTITVNPIPAAPTTVDVARCGDGAISSSATSSSPSPVYNWFTNISDVTAVYTGATRNISNLTVTKSEFVSVTSLGCESTRKSVTFTRNAPQLIDLGSAITLCSGQAPYNLENDIVDPVAKGNNFTWTAGANNYSSKTFNPVSVVADGGLGTYTVTYVPPSSAQVTPYCYLTSTRSITVSSGAVAITFTDPLVNSGNTVNTCIGNQPIVISNFPSVIGGSWSTVIGSGITSSGSTTVFTPVSSNYTSSTPNQFRYTVTSGGCSGTKDLFIYVKDNQSIPVVSGLPTLICPNSTLTLSASVSNVGTFSYQWFKSGNIVAFASTTSIIYPVTSSEDLLVRSLDTNFGCLSTATTVPIKTPFATGQIGLDKSTINSGEKVSFNYSGTNSGNTYQWDFGDGFKSYEKNPIHFYYYPGSFNISLKISSTLGCSQTITYSGLTVNGTPVIIITGNEPNSNDNNALSVFPTPFDNVLSITSGSKIKSVIIYSLIGVIQKEIKLINSNSIDIDLSNLTEGVYILNVENNVSTKHRILKK